MITSRSVRPSGCSRFPRPCARSAARRRGGFARPTTYSSITRAAAMKTPRTRWTRCSVCGARALGASAASRGATAGSDIATERAAARSVFFVLARGEKRLSLRERMTSSAARGWNFSHKGRLEKTDARQCAKRGERPYRPMIMKDAFKGKKAIFLRTFFLVNDRKV